MSTREDTAEKAKSILSGHSAPYIKRAREVLPLLVVLAEGRRTISYGSLAAILGMPNPRNLNFPLGSVGETLRDLSGEFRHRVPPLQSLVENAQTHQPGGGCDAFIKQWLGVAAVTPKNREGFVRAVQSEVHRYDKWDKVLLRLGMARHGPFEKTISDATELPSGRSGTGESPEHRALKVYAAAHSEQFSLPSGAIAVFEKPLPSGDKVDVFFDTGVRWTALEVKSRVSGDDDIARGVFQCIKYAAVLRAVATAKRVRAKIEAVLVLESPPSPTVVALAATLGVRVQQVNNLSTPPEVLVDA